jgi:hypothetical protein
VSHADFLVNLHALHNSNWERLLLKGVSTSAFARGATRLSLFARWSLRGLGMPGRIPGPAGGSRQQVAGVQIPVTSGPERPPARSAGPALRLCLLSTLFRSPSCLF